MPSFSTPAIMLRRIDHGDYDLIITCFSLTKGKISIIAKYAKKSVKRFSGLLELFFVLNVVCHTGRGRGLPVLQEAVLKHPFSEIRGDIKTTAYASYWAQLIIEWMEEGQKHEPLYYLFQHVLEKLDQGHMSGEALSILFQMRFMEMAGLDPNLNECSICRVEMERIKKNEIIFDLKKGGLVCEKCASGSAGPISLSKGTIKQLLWVKSGELKKAGRLRFTSRALKEGIEFLEAFVPYHLGKEPRSLKFLREIR
ncbi:MAG: DNA repair protein RecO [Deltaproteobacteria bacterium]|nr:DNA repair protein RecO [Deltaproteobacteria bacterium]